ncbi:MAG: bifunctional riboflavin kinase/FAD synthetase [Nitrospinota bacterium]|nr:bifunctional riboflavin kinase/FAD synthetase [Nitrospinota bacterium]
MKIGDKVSDFSKEFTCSIATVGNFDGLHLGHREIMKQVKEESARQNCKSLVITFEPHPSSILYPTRNFFRLTSPERRAKLIAECGIDGLLAIPFTIPLSEKDPRAFVEEIMVPLKLRRLYVGHDFTFGSGRKGNVYTLKREGEILGFSVHEIPEVEIDGETVRSTRIRALLAEGNIEKVTKLLGREHAVSGVVIKGAGRGKILGFPTANLGQTVETVPGPGVYATKVELDGKLYDSATHVGVIPTFDVDVPGIEAHIFDFNSEITGQNIEIRFIAKVRDTARFASIDELKEQIRKDCEDIRRLL